MTGPDLDPRTHARTSDPGTSHEAAARLTNKRTMMRRLLTEFLRRPMTAWEAGEACGYSADEGAWKRVSDLANEGWVEDTGATRIGPKNRRQIVWAITDDGRAAL
jgi:hypothetical protein